MLAGAFFIRTSGFGGLLRELDNVIGAAAIVQAPGLFLRAYRNVPPVPKKGVTPPGD